MSEKFTPENCDPSTGCCSPKPAADTTSSQSIVRRDFLKAMGLLSGGMLLDFPAFGLKKPNPTYTIPTDKGFSAAWYESLYQRGEPESYSGKDLAYIGMPIGGLFTGTVYIGGDGKLWLWDIFNQQKEGIVDITYENWQGKKRVRPRDGANFIFPVSPEYPFEQGFGICVLQDKSEWKKSLDFKGFEEITFKGQYPIAEVSYRDAQLPVQIDLQAFSPFVPLDVDSSSYPATVMRFRVTNTSKKKASVELSGWLENAVLNNSENTTNVTLVNRVEKSAAHLALFCTAQTDTESVKNQRDFGNMALLLLDAGNSAKGDAGVPVSGDLLFPQNQKTEESAIHGEQLCGALSQSLDLNPGESKDITFIISWYFPNITLPQNENSKGINQGRYYKKRFQNALEVGVELAERFADLHSQTVSWRETFYTESTLPHWFLNRTFLNTSILATETCFLLEDGRFWGWEGIGCCAGNCTHVWHYAQALGRMFPELEKNLREKTDFAVIDPASGGIDFRGALARQYAADGQAGVVLRAYRDFLLSADHSFLKKNWTDIKLALQYLINLDKEDGEANGTIFGEQHNTLDAEWFGNIPVITSLYLAALAASVEMAIEMNDTSSEATYRAILEAGKANIEKLFNGEYFVQNEDPAHKDAIGVGAGCYIDQVFGQGWAYQVGLGRLYNENMIVSSLESLWKYNFVPDMGVLRASLSPEINGRPYALSGDSGLVMCTWPLGGKRDDWEKHWQYGYFNECMTGFEHQVASHMIWEGLLDYGFSIEKSIHERYSPAKRNPYNEIECSDHYSRAMASYGAYIAACGFTYHGPKGQLGFAPKIHPENFKAAFTGVEGWGTLEQERTAIAQSNRIKLNYGKLALQEIRLELPKEKTAKSIQVTVNGRAVDSTFEREGNKIKVIFPPVTMLKGDVIAVGING